MGFGDFLSGTVDSVSDSVENSAVGRAAKSVSNTAASVGSGLDDFGKKASAAASDFGKKASNAANEFGKKATKVLDKADEYLPDAAKVAHQVEDVSGMIAKGAGTAAGIAAATGIGNAGVSEALAGISAAAYGVNKGAGAIAGGLDKAQAVSGVARSGIERVRK